MRPLAGKYTPFAIMSVVVCIHRPADNRATQTVWPMRFMGSAPSSRRLGKPSEPRLRVSPAEVAAKTRLSGMHPQHALTPPARNERRVRPSEIIDLHLPVSALPRDVET